MSGPGSRRPPPCRRFTLLDGMILVGGAAVGFAGARGRDWNDLGEGWAEPALNVSGVALMLLSALILALRLRRPRPPIRRIARQPGAAACFAAVLYGVLYDAECLLTYGVWRVVPDRTVEAWIWFLLWAPARKFAYIIPVVWALMALGRGWRAEPGWVDRLGRAVGVGWIAWGLAGWFVQQR